VHSDWTANDKLVEKTREVTDPGQEKWIPEDVKDLVDPSLHPPEKIKDERKRLFHICSL